MNEALNNIVNTDYMDEKYGKCARKPATRRDF
jgi:hypothetical protein